jgi:hypothetical protein
MTREESVGGLARRLWQAVARGDADAVLSLFAPDAVFTRMGHNPLAGEFKGRSAVLDALAGTGEAVDQLRSQLLEVLVGERSAVVRFRMRASRAGHELDGEFFMYLRADGGRIVAATQVPLDQARNDAFWNAVVPAG